MLPQSCKGLNGGHLGHDSKAPAREGNAPKDSLGTALTNASISVTNDPTNMRDFAAIGAFLARNRLGRRSLPAFSQYIDTRVSYLPVRKVTP
jgi:hypothetical protein